MVGGVETGIFVQFRSWLGEIGGVEGCPAGCRYCFLHPVGKSPQKPVFIVSPQEVINSISDIYPYHPEIPFNFAGQTDIFSTKGTIDYYYELLKIYGQSKYPNPVVLITKRSIPDKFIDLAGRIPQKTIFYVSYSGLNNTKLEPTINEAEQRDNFVRLRQAGMPAVHYWRPFFPQNSTDEIIARILNHVSKYALCSVAVGLHLNPNILKSVASFWPELLHQQYDFNMTGEFWPEGVLDKLQVIINEKYTNYPVFLTNTPCSISYALNKPDMQGYRFDSMCEITNCPDKQRQLCSSDQVGPTVEESLGKIGIDPRRAHLEQSSLIIDGHLDAGILVYLSWLLHIPVVSSEVPNDKGYNWASASCKKSLGIIEVPWESGRIEI